jgi:hypothetical protein
MHLATDYIDLAHTIHGALFRSDELPNALLRIADYLRKPQAGTLAMRTRGLSSATGSSSAGHRQDPAR